MAWQDISSAEWASEADAQAFLNDMVIHGKAWSQLGDDGKKRHVPLSSVFDRPAPPIAGEG